MKSILIISLLVLSPFLLFGQESTLYKSNLIKTNLLNIEYMDFGGEGMPLIVIQGAHNYFDLTSPYKFRQDENKSWIEFYSMFTESNRVIAPLKRGFGKTDPQTANDNVQTTTDDLLSLMDELGIQKAFFIGRDVPAQNMLYLAENYPERILGLIFIQPVFVFTDIQDEATKEFLYNGYAESYSATEYEKFKWKISQIYRPQIFSDSSLSLKTPALLFYNSAFSEETLELRRVERFLNWVETAEKIEWSKEYSSPEIANYFRQLSMDKERIYHIRDYLRENNPTPKMNNELERAFGNNMVVFNESIMQVNDVRSALLNVYYPVIKAFIFMTTEK